jgi:hypothetical protein
MASGQDAASTYIIFDSVTPAIVASHQAIVASQAAG